MYELTNRPNVRTNWPTDCTTDQPTVRTNWPTHRLYDLTDGPTVRMNRRTDCTNEPTDRLCEWTDPPTVWTNWPTDCTRCCGKESTQVIHIKSTWSCCIKHLMAVIFFYVKKTRPNGTQSSSNTQKVIKSVYYDRWVWTMFNKLFKVMGLWRSFNH